MSWVRLDDQFAHHPKVLKAGPIASFLWISCIAYSQKFLTDGFIPGRAIATICDVPNPIKQARRLVSIGLLEVADDGYQVHDYLKFNESSASVKQRREQDRVRKESSRNPAGIQPESSRTPTRARARAPHPIHSDQKDIGKQQQGKSTPPPAPTNNGNGHGDARSKRPMFTGQRLTVFEWMTDDHMKLLGKHIDKFDLHEWYFKLDERMVSEELVQPRRDSGAWVEAELVAEAQRQKIPLKFAKAPTDKMTEDEKWKEVARLGPMKRGVAQ